MGFFPGLGSTSRLSGFHWPGGFGKGTHHTSQIAPSFARYATCIWLSNMDTNGSPAAGGALVAPSVVPLLFSCCGLDHAILVPSLSSLPSAFQSSRAPKLRVF